MNTKKHKVLLVEDDVNFGSVLKDYLQMNGYIVDLAPNGNLGWNRFNNDVYDLAVLDVMMPEKDGFSLADDIRRSGSEIPIVFLTARTLKEDIIKGFKLGADDYIIKPFDTEVLLFKLKAMLNRSSNDVSTGEGVDEYTIGKYTFKYSSRELIAGAESKRLSPKEADLLKLLVNHIDKVLPREKALLKLWGNSNYFNARSMDVFVTRLRKHLQDEPTVEIVNIHGKGYRFTIS